MSSTYLVLTIHALHLYKKNLLTSYKKGGLFKSKYVCPRVIYDRVLNEKNYFEIPTFFMFERGKSRAGKFKPMLNYSINYFILNFPLLTFLVQT